MPKIKVTAQRTSVPIKGTETIVAHDEEIEITDEDLADLKARGYVGFVVEEIKEAAPPQKGKGK